MKSHPAIKPALWGAVVGAVAMMVLGFWQLGWMLGSTAEKLANDRGDAAAVAALAPVCVAKFQAQGDAAAKLAALKKVASSWDQKEFIEKGGWATMPGSDAPNPAVARACAETLGKQA